MSTRLLTISDESMDAIEDLALEYYFENRTGQMLVQKQNTPSKNMKALTKMQGDFYLSGFINAIIALLELGVIDCEALLLDSLRDDIDDDVPESIKQALLALPNYQKGILELLFNYENFITGSDTD